ncbi:uncharacterized protein ACLA_043360 [Aspergillus clavatus NRRL 1]|uniref:DUF202 domain-containing protein n=1 Tax=Aspergillus clavatus (strain ATCC 1007 / CBS 513.65 / DSM 816 / NCTC 3887 / NRRL 1 / QM 1276 / 107) TaxID=344612 RepID=A1C8I0_ASPCL|nr:uncharacterized protein ACLA_043360 [Aspergillus clavatus NRRL 1]EAW13617.1 hypothetical protein ACLA_043360 [Aspergillus clavatus NRRL 1]
MASAVWRRILPQRVANTGSQLRDHQANERTFLSWTRMGLGFAAMALALGRLDAIDRMIASALSSTKLNLVVLPEHAGQQQMQAVPVRPSGNSATASAPTTAPPSPTSPTTSRTAKSQRQDQAPSPSASATGAPQGGHGFGRNGLSAATLCQGISVWSFGYGIFRYLSVRQNVLRGQFTPAIWGPAFMTCGCLGLFGTMGMWMDRRTY